MAKGNKAGPLMLFIMGVIFTAAGLAVVYFFGVDITLDCKRSINQCSIESKNIFGEIEIVESFNLDEIEKAEVIHKRSTDGDYTYKVMLITSQGGIPLTNSSSSDSKSHRKNARKINNYVNSFEENLEVEESGNIARIFGFIFAGVGGLMLLGSLGGLLKLILLLFVMLSRRGS